MKKKRIFTPEQKAKQKIYCAKWYQDNKEKRQRQMQEWNQENKEERKQYMLEWYKNNPDYIQPSAVDLGYWVVYLIHDYNGLGDTYCGQTQNIYKRMVKHKSRGTLNSDKYELIKQCETLKDALEFEAYMHEQGYHGK